MWEVNKEEQESSKKQLSLPSAGSESARVLFNSISGEASRWWRRRDASNLN